MINGGMPDNFNGGYNQNNYYMPPPQPIKEKYSIEKRDMVFVLLSLICAITWVILTLWGGFKAGFTISYLFFFIVTSVFLHKKGVKPGAFSCLAGILALVSAFIFGYSNNTSVNIYLFIAMFFESALWFSSLCGVKDNGSELGIITHGFSTVFGKSFGKLPKTLRSVFDNKNEKMKGVGKVLIGILCALPLLVIVVPLLISADGAFEGLIRKIGDNIGELIAQIAIGILITPFIISYAFGLNKDENKEKPQKEIKGIDNAFVISFLSVLSIVYVTYLFSQLAYFVDAFKGILPETFIPSAYARRGFFEMSIIAGINFIVIYLALLLSRKKENKTSKAVGGVCTFIIVFTLFLIATALAKMVIYIGYFGMTVLRIGTSAFMIFLAIVFIALIFRCFIKKVPVIKIALVTATCVLLALGFMNVGKFVAEYNVNAYKNNKLQTIDVNTIKKQGMAGVPALYDVYKNVPEYKFKAEKALTALYKETVENEREIGDWSITDQIGYDFLDKFAEEKQLKEIFFLK